MYSNLSVAQNSSKNWVDSSFDKLLQAGGSHCFSEKDRFDHVDTSGAVMPLHAAARLPGTKPSPLRGGSLGFSHLDAWANEDGIGLVEKQQRQCARRDITQQIRNDPQHYTSGQACIVLSDYHAITKWPNGMAVQLLKLIGFGGLTTLPPDLRVNTLILRNCNHLGFPNGFDVPILVIEDGGDIDLPQNSAISHLFLFGKTRVINTSAQQMNLPVVGFFKDNQVTFVKAEVESWLVTSQLSGFAWLDLWVDESDMVLAERIARQAMRQRIVASMGNLYPAHSTLSNLSLCLSDLHEITSLPNGIRVQDLVLEGLNRLIKWPNDFCIQKLTLRKCKNILLPDSCSIPVLVVEDCDDFIIPADSIIQHMLILGETNIINAHFQSILLPMIGFFRSNRVTFSNLCVELWLTNKMASGISPLDAWSNEDNISMGEIVQRQCARRDILAAINNSSKHSYTSGTLCVRLKDYDEITTLPEGMKVKEMDLVNMKSLTKLPQSFAVDSLSLHHCNNLLLPENFVLRELCVSNCRNFLLPQKSIIRHLSLHGNTYVLNANPEELLPPSVSCYIGKRVEFTNHYVRSRLENKLLMP